MVKGATRIVGVLGGLAACTGSNRHRLPADTLAVRDSAGIRIVEHPAGYEATLPIWSLEDSARVDIGSGGPGHDLDLVRGVLRLSDGRLVVLNAGTSELRFFDSTGKYLSTAGRRGNGPGEFVSPVFISRLTGDTVAVLDGQLGRWSLLSPSGTFIRSVTTFRRDEKSYVISLGRLADGRFLGMRYPMLAMRETSGPVRRDSQALGLIGADGSGFAQVALVPGGEMYPSVGSEGGHEFPTIKSLEFGRQTTTVTDGERIIIGSNEPMGIRIYDTDGRIRVFIRSATPSEPVTEQHRKRRAEDTRARLQRQRAASEQIRAEWLKNAENPRYAEVFPFYDRLLIGSDGTLWVELPRRYEDEGRRYVVYDTTGVAVARVNCPERLRPYEVGPERIIGVWRDPDEVPHVQVYAVLPTVAARPAPIKR